MKICQTCGETKPLDEFYKRRGAVDGYRGDCKACVAERSRMHYENNREAHLEGMRRYRETNREAFQARRRELYQVNREKNLERRRQYVRDNPEAVQAASRKRQQKHPLYPTWKDILRRCENPSTRGYKHYGGRGIEVCAEWHDYETFAAWILENLGPRPKGMTVDRYPDNNGDYRPGNVRWATAKEQAANRRPRSRVQTLRNLVGGDRVPMYCPVCGEPLASLNAFDAHWKRQHAA